jgi:hypothetical protein
MTVRSLFETRILGRPVIERLGEATRLEGHYPNPEKGMKFFRAVTIISMLTLISAPALYYGAPASPPQTLGELLAAIIGGIPSALAPLVELARNWQPDQTLPDLQGWNTGLGLAVIFLMFGSLLGRIGFDLIDRPYLTVEVRDATLSIQRGFLGTPVNIPRDECLAVHVGRRRSGHYEVLIQHSDTLMRIPRHVATCSTRMWPVIP